tara:strand:- start:4296 stop:4490 length:195 start_codon:yes stop_codon:yes gene_type:complete
MNGQLIFQKLKQWSYFMTEPKQKAKGKTEPEQKAKGKADMFTILYQLTLISYTFLITSPYGIIL